MVKSRDEKESEKLTRLIDKQFDNKFVTYSKHAEVQNQTWQRKLDIIIDGKLAPFKTDLHKLKTDVKIVKTAVTDTNRELLGLENRVVRLEAA